MEDMATRVWDGIGSTLLENMRSYKWIYSEVIDPMEDANKKTDAFMNIEELVSNVFFAGFYQGQSWQKSLALTDADEDEE